MIDMKKLREKYINLLLDKCIHPKNNSLFITYDKGSSEFINVLKKIAREKGYNNIITEEKDVFYEHKLLKNLTASEIKVHPYFLNNTWDKALESNCAFLMASSPFPNYFEDIEQSKIIAANEATTKSRQKYMQSVMNDSISWTIFGLPNKIWADKLFPNDADSYEKLERLIYSFCMIDKDNPLEKWQKYINIEHKKTDLLNSLNIKSLILKNDLGTNLTIGLVDNYIFRSLENNHCIENIPTYSIWTSPHKYKADGIVYNSLPITYKNYNIEHCWFKFSDGKVIDYGAEKGKEYLDDFFSRGDSYKRLGEIAIIDFDSPISKTQTIYNCNLFDENISTHLALGCAYQNTTKNGSIMNEEELDSVGCNVCPEHMDFTIGSRDFKIIAITADDKEIKIFENGNFNYRLINEESPFK